MNATPSRHRDRRLRVGLLGALLVTLWAGLHPFSFLCRNDVSWLREGSGLKFSESSMAYSVGRPTWDTSKGPASLGIELWLAPAGRTSEERDILVLADEPSMPVLLLYQSGVDLIVAARVTNADGERWYNAFVFPDVLSGPGLRHVALISGTPRPLLYLDGRRIEAASGYGIPLARAGTPLGGRLIVGTSARAQGSWLGTLHGLLLHARAPLPAEMQRGGAQPAQAIERAALEPGVLAAYAFTEGSGSEAADLSGAGLALHLPTFYRPIDVPAFGLAPLCTLRKPHTLLDIGVNLVGFLPLGFLLALFLLSAIRLAPLPTLLVVGGAGALVSFTIEALQVLMPTRDSSLLDFLLNTLGAALGAWMALRFARSRQRPDSVSAGSAP